MPEEIIFVNHKPAECGCTSRFSDGGGQYSNVFYITPCSAHSPKAFGPVEVVRDKDGWWFHPGVPDFGGDEDPAPYLAWVKAEGFELKSWSMEGDLDDHPYWDLASDECGCKGWDPESPGPEWFLMGIFDTEDGPYVQWARRLVTP
jgi:hypothetical protein